MIFNPATGDGSTQSSEESNTETNDTVTNSGRYRYWSSDISEAAIEIDEEGNSAKFYSLQTGYYAYYAVDEATYSLKGTSFVLTLNGTDYTFVYDDNENTLSIPNTDETQDDIVYTAMEDAPTPHPSYTFPTFADLSFPSSFTLGSLDFDVIREFSLEEAKIKIAIDYYENGLETFPKITDRAIQRGDYVSIDYIGKMGGEYIQNSGHNDQPVAIIMHPENIDGITYPAEFIEALVGHNVGDYFEVTITYPEGHQYAGKTAIFEVTVKAIYDTVLTMNQLNNYENFEFESYDAYLLDTAKTLASHLAIPHLVDTSNAIEALPEESYQFFYQEFFSLLLSEVQKRITALEIEVEFDPSVAALVAKEGFDPVYGARPLRRAIVRLVEDAFSNAMLEGKFRKGDRVLISEKEGALSFEKCEKTAPSAE